MTGVAPDMSFRSRLTLFFVLIVIVPMVSLTFVLFRLIADNENGKHDERVGARQAVAIKLYEASIATANAGAERVGRDVALATALRRDDPARARKLAQQLLKSLTLKRIVIIWDTRTFVDVGARNATFPVTRRLVARTATGTRTFGTLQVSAQGPRTYALLVHRVTGLDVVVSRDNVPIASTISGLPSRGLPGVGQGRLQAGDRQYRTSTFAAPGFAGSSVHVSVLDSSSQTNADVQRSRLLAGGILVGFFILAFTFAVLVSRSLQRQIGGFLEAARRLGRGDFTAQVPTVGHDEFAALGVEFNRMSTQLEGRLEELRAQQRRLAAAIRRIGETFASNLDRDALLEIVVRTARDGVGAAGGRATLRAHEGAPLHQVAQAGSLDGLVPSLHAAESAVLEAGAAQEASTGGVFALAHPLRAGHQPGEQGPPRVTGIVSVARGDRAFEEGERELFHYLVGQASLSIENVALHETVERQAVTDELTGLSNRRRFQEALSTEAERSRRFGQPVGLALLDIDDFKAVNDTYGHQAGDHVLCEIARIVRESSREIDEPARYGGEELAVVLPGTDLQGAFDLAERMRAQIARLQLPMQTSSGAPLSVTASFGVATMPASANHVGGLIEAADAALYKAKRSGKNRTVRAQGVGSA